MLNIRRATVRNMFVILPAFVLICSLERAIAQKEEVPQASSEPLGVRVQLRSVLLDLHLGLFTAGVGGSLDLDILHFPAKYQSSLGLRLGVDYYRSGGPGGETGGSPFADYNILARHTASGSLLRFDIYYGWSYYTTSRAQFYPARGGAKFGVELRLKVVDHFFALLLKASKPAGIGTTFGWDR